MTEPDCGYCQLCEPPRRVELTALFDHLRIVHDFTELPAEWPDGGLVIVDNTLEPQYFDE